MKLDRLNASENPTGETFEITYRDIDGVVDFMILKWQFDIGICRHWELNDRFRCVINNKDWYFGRIERIEPHDQKFINSEFKKYKIKWDDGTTDELSCWELEPIKNSSIKSNK